jgi:hypothetical protein
MRGWLFNLNLGPVSFQFFRDKHWQRGHNALAHL